MSRAEHLPITRRMNASGGFKALMPHGGNSFARNENGVLQFDDAADLLVSPNAGERALDIFSFDVADEVFRYGSVDDFQFRYAHSHDDCPITRDTAHGYQNTSARNLNQNSLNDSRNRFRDASCAVSKQNAARHEGLSHLTALVHALRGGSAIQFGPIFIPAHVARKYSARNIIAAVHFHIRNSFAISPRSSHSLKSHLRSGVAALVASNSLARPSLAGAERGLEWNDSLFFEMPEQVAS